MKIQFTTNSGISIGFLSINKRDINNVVMTPVNEAKSSFSIENYFLNKGEMMMRISGILIGKKGKEVDLSIEVIPPPGLKKPAIYKDSYFLSDSGKFVFVAQIKLQELQQGGGGFQGKRKLD